MGRRVATTPAGFSPMIPRLGCTSWQSSYRLCFEREAPEWAAAQPSALAAEGFLAYDPVARVHLMAVLAKIDPLGQ